MLKWIGLTLTHLTALAIGFAVGIYMLPILTAPPAPTEAELGQLRDEARYRGEFRRDLKGSDALHWGEGKVYVGAQAIALDGRLAPGPDYRLYLSPRLVETESEFIAMKSSMVRVGEVKTFRNFVVDLPTEIDPSRFRAVIVWCESFGEFITAAAYR